MKQYKFKQIKRKDGSEYFYKKLFHRNLVSQNVRSNVAAAPIRQTQIKKMNEIAVKKLNDTSDRVSAQIDMKKINFFNSGSVQRLREDHECMNMLSQCSRALT